MPTADADPNLTPTPPPTLRWQWGFWLRSFLCLLATAIHYLLHFGLMFPLRLLAGLLMAVGGLGESLKDCLDDAAHQLQMILAPRTWKEAIKAFQDAKDAEGRSRFFIDRCAALREEVEYWKGKTDGVDDRFPTFEHMPALTLVPVQPVASSKEPGSDSEPPKPV